MLSVTPGPKHLEINSVDRISPSKIHPPTSRPPKIQSNPRNNITGHDSSFISGKTNQTHYPLYTRSK